MIGTFTTNGVVDEETQKNGLYIVSGWGRSNLHRSRFDPSPNFLKGLPVVGALDR